MKAQEIIDQIAAYPRFPKESRLERVQAYLNLLGNPEKQLKFVHVTGTNGKGSTCALMESALREAGYKVGLFTSPHLFDWRERIQINREPIADSAIEQFGGGILDFEVGVFEAWFLMALSYFAANQVDIVILEAGIGGRLDTTNIIPSPEVSVLTNVDLEHTELLGLTKEAIALEKAAIKKKSVLVTGIEDPEVRAILPEHRFVTSEGPFWEKNKAVAEAALQVLRERGWKIKDQDLRLGLKTAYWPFRMEVLSEEPFILVDVGHNPHGIRAVKAALPSKNKGKRWLWMGISEDKDYGQMAALMSEGMDTIILSEASYHACPAEELADFVVNETVIPNLNEAAKYLSDHIDQNDQLFILGGLYFAVEAVQALKKSELLK